MNGLHRAQIAGGYQRNTIQVAYEDMANPYRVGTVVEHIAGEFRVAWDDEQGGDTWSDLRQTGWSRVTPFPGVAVPRAGGIPGDGWHASNISD